MITNTQNHSWKISYVKVETKPLFQRTLLFPRSGEEAGFSVWCVQSSEKSLVHSFTKTLQTQNSNKVRMDY